MNRVKELRFEKNITQSKLAKNFNISQQAISKYEKGIKDMDYSLIKSMSNFFNVSPEYLLGSSLERGTSTTFENIPQESKKTNFEFSYKYLVKKWWFWLFIIWIIGFIGMNLFPNKTVSPESTIYSNKLNDIVNSRFNDDGSFKLDSTSGSNDAELEIFKKAKEDSNIYSKEDIPKIIEYINSHTTNPWESESIMEQFIYLGTIVDKSPHSTDKEKSIGYKAKSIVSFVYRDLETIEESKVGLDTLIKRLKEYNN